MIDVLVLGVPYWSARIADALNGQGLGFRARPVDQRSYAQLVVRPPRSDRVVLIRAGFRVGATTRRGRLFDAYWAVLRRALPRAAVCHYWLGTDVLHTLEEARAGTLRRTVVAAARDDLHLAGAPWLAAELEEVGLGAVATYVPSGHRMTGPPGPLPEDFRVLSYLPADRLAFYGGDTVIEAARRMPDVGFDILGASGPPRSSAPPNISWHGWVSDIQGTYARSTVVVRIPRHDGFGGTVIEGLLHGRHVIYNQVVPYTHYLAPVSADGLVAALTGLQAEHRAGRLRLNLDGRAWVTEEFDQARVAARLAAAVRRALG